MWTCGFLPKWKKKPRWSCELWFLVRLNIQMQVYDSELHLCDCRDLHSVFWAKFLRSHCGGDCGQRWLVQDKWAVQHTAAASNKSVVIPFCHCSVASASFRGFLIQQRSWKAEFVIREYSRAIDFVFLNKKSRVPEFFVHWIEKVDFQRWLQNRIYASGRPLLLIWNVLFCTVTSWLRAIF